MLAAFVPLLMIAYIGVAIALFIRLPRPIAVLTICVLGTLFLPEVQSNPVAKDPIRPIRIPLLEFTKVNAMSYGLLLSWLLLDGARFSNVRWSIWDVPALIMSIFPALATMINGGSFDDAFAELRSSSLTWGVPYLIGRVYLGGEWGIRWATIAIIIGGLIYLPFVLLETRFAPVLHFRVYGFQQHSFTQTIRWGGYRPMVFLQHGLAVGLWLASATLCAFWLWWTQSWSFSRAPRLAVLALAATTVLAKSFGAIALAFGGAVVLLVSVRFRTRLALVALLLVPVTYVACRTLEVWKGQGLVDAVGKNVTEERSASLEFRIDAENKLMKVMGSNWLFGKGAGGKQRPKDDEGFIIIPDGQWIITYFDTGAIGITALLAFFLTPAARFMSLHPANTWAWPMVAPAAVGSVILVLLMIDCLFNAMLNPVYFLLAAALNGWNDSVEAMQADAAPATHQPTM